MIAGASSRLPFDDLYRGFYDLVAGAIAAALSRAQAFETECQRVQALTALDRAKTAFFSNVSHEFRTPLTLMLGPLEDTLADADDLSSSNRDRLDVVRRNAFRLLKLVNSLLDFSRVEAARARAHFEPVDLATLTSDLASSFLAPPASARGSS
jgi:signal transduction histidine kinase